MRYLLPFAMSLVLTGLGLAQENDRSDISIEDQGLAIEQIEANAASASFKGTENFDAAVYYAHIEQGLALITGHPSGKGRAFLARPKTIPKAPVSPEAIELMRNDVARQEQIKRQLRKAIGIRVVNGEVVGKSEYTSAVALRNVDLSLTCTGVVIRSGVILTAAHCVCAFRYGRFDGDNLEITTSKRDWNETRAFFGNPGISGDTLVADISGGGFIKSPGGVVKEPVCDRMRTHRKICSPDLAVLMYPDGKTPDYVTPAALPSSDLVNSFLDGDSGATVDAVGFGAKRLERENWTTASGLTDVVPQNNKLLGTLPVYGRCPVNACGLKSHGCSIEDDLVMMDHGFINTIDQVDTCTGDSGGPVFFASEIENGIVNGRPNTLIGITSRPRLDSDVCGPGGIYARVDTNHVRSFLADYLE